FVQLHDAFPVHLNQDVKNVQGHAAVHGAGPFQLAAGQLGRPAPDHHPDGLWHDVSGAVDFLGGAPDRQLHGLGLVHHVGGLFVQGAERDLQLHIAEMADCGIVDLSQDPGAADRFAGGLKVRQGQFVPHAQQLFPVVVHIVIVYLGRNIFAHGLLAS
ncbi:SLH domain-containing protein, partial [Dysosmobacter welbionis]